jgi:GNAT superfamily N-acetyltransferase
MKIEHTTTPNSQDILFLTEQINSDMPPGLATFEPFGFFIRDEYGAIIAGCNGYAGSGRIYTDQLWVHPSYRKKGLGRKLMNSVHEYGRKVGCTMATLETMSFQVGRKFYENLGYEVDFERHGYAHNSSAIFLKKML